MMLVTSTVRRLVVVVVYYHISAMSSKQRIMVLLYEVLSNEDALADKPIAILFNKLDLVGDPQTTLHIFYNILRIDDLKNKNNTWAKLVLLSGTALDTSCNSGSVKTACDWIVDSGLLQY